MAVALRAERMPVTDYSGPRAELRARIVGAISARVKAGETQHGAAQIVMRELLADGLAVEVLDLLGPGPILQLWEKWRARDRRPGGYPSATGARTQPAPPNPPARRVDTGALQAKESLLESLVRLDGVWIPLGDLVQAQCRQVERLLARKERQAGIQRRAFGLLADRLPSATARVRDQLGEGDIVGIFREAAQR